ncbi:hypothetical protein YC2023_061397 [Brassica napus]
MIGRRRLVVVVLSPASVVDKPGYPALRVVPYGDCLSMVKAPGSSGSAIDGPDSRVDPWGAHGRNRWWSSRYAAGSMELQYALMIMECPCRHEKSLGLEDGGREDGGRSQTRGQGPGTQSQGPGPGRRDPGSRGRNPDPGGRDLEDGSWRNNMTFFIGLYKLHCIITLPCRSFSDALALDTGVGRKFDGEAGSIGIKGDASNHTPGACAASVAILGLSSGRALWFHESCGGVYGSVPRNSERESLGEAKDQEDEEAVMEFQEDLRVEGTFSMFILVPGDNLVDSWYQSRSPGHVSHHQCWDDLASCFHGTQRILGMLSQNLEEPGGRMDFRDLPVHLFDLKSYSSGRLSLIARSLLGTQRFNGRILGSNGTVVLLHNPEMLLGPEGRFWSPEAASDPEIAFRTRRSIGNPEVPLDPEVVFRTLRSFWDPEVDWVPGGSSRPRGRFGTRRLIGNPEVPLDPEVVFRTLRSFRNLEIGWEPGGEATTGTCWDFTFYRSEADHYRVPMLHAALCRKPLSDLGVLVMDSETQVPGFFCFPRLEKQEFMYCSLHVADRSRGWSRSFVVGVGVGTSSCGCMETRVSLSDVGFDRDGLADALVSFDIRQLDTGSLDL